jgi:hypothetical protein
MEQKRRGRPPGTGKKEQTIVNIPVGEGKKRGRKRIEKPLNILLPNMQMEGEIEGSEVEKLKDMAIKIQIMEETLNHEPYRIDLRMQKHDMLNRMCYLIKFL